MNDGRLIFVLEIPPSFQSDLLAGRQASLQLNVDATAMAQAGNGAVYIQSIIAQELANFEAGREGAMSTPVNVVIRAKFNPNLYSSWFSSVMQVVNNITMLAVILTGAALIREREQGTVEHLLVMPVVPAEIMLSKIIANGLVILIAAGLSLSLVVEALLKVPIAGSLTLFLAGATLYALTVAALGILLGTHRDHLGQFALLAIPVLLVMQLLSGSATPMESMPVWLQHVMRIICPTPHFVAFSQAVLYRGADLSIVWPLLVAIAAIGSVYFAFALQPLPPRDLWRLKNPMPPPPEDYRYRWRASAARAAANSFFFSASTFGYVRSSFSTASTIAAATTSRVNHLLSAGTTYHGACFDAVARIASSNACM